MEIQDVEAEWNEEEKRESVKSSAGIYSSSRARQKMNCPWLLAAGCWLVVVCRSAAKRVVSSRLLVGRWPMGQVSLGERR